MDARFFEARTIFNETRTPPRASV